MLIDGTPFGDQQLITAIRADGASPENGIGTEARRNRDGTVVKQLLEDLRERGVDFEVPRLHSLDGGKALFAGVKHAAGKAGIVQTLPDAQIRNVIGHLIRMAAKRQAVESLSAKPKPSKSRGYCK